MAFNENQMTRMGPAQPDGQTVVGLIVQPDYERKYITRPWNEVGSIVQGIFVPLGSLVGNDGLRQFLFNVAEQDTVKHADKYELRPAEYHIVGASGRNVKVCKKGPFGFGAWADHAEFLLGTGAPCEDFDISNGVMFARLKSEQQLQIEFALGCMDEQAASKSHFLDPEGELAPGGFHRRLCDGFSDAPEQQAAKPAPRGRKPRRPKGNALIVLQHMEANHRTDAPAIEDLCDEIGEQMECPRAGRRNEYLRKAVARLADTEVDKWLWRHSGDRVALTATLPGGNGDPF